VVQKNSWLMTELMVILYFTGW